MPLINVVIVLIVVGVLMWLANTYIPMDANIKKILNAVVVIAVVLWLLGVFGVYHAFSGVRIGIPRAGARAHVQNFVAFWTLKLACRGSTTRVTRVPVVLFGPRFDRVGLKPL